MTLQIQEPTIRARATAKANQEQQQIKNNSKSKSKNNSKSKSKNNSNRPTSANGGQKWGTRKSKSRATATTPLKPTAGLNGPPIWLSGRGPC
jgi:hypothetical protein